MNRRFLGLICGVVFGVTDVLLTVFGNHPVCDNVVGWLAAIGVLAANVSLGMDQIWAGALTGLLISLPDAFALNSYLGVLGTGVAFGAAAGWVSKKWGN